MNQTIDKNPTSTPKEHAPKGKASKDRLSILHKPRMLAGLIVAVVVLAIAGVRYWSFASSHVSTDNAAVTSDVVQIAPQVSGTVKQVLVKDNQEVKAGDLLVVLDDATYRAAVAQAQANLDAAVAQGRGAGVSVSLTADTGSAQQLQAGGVLDQAESGIYSAKADVARSEAVVASATATSRSAEANVGTAKAAFDVAVANKQRFSDAVNSAHALLDSAKASVRAAKALSDKSAHDLERYTALASQGAISKQRFDEAESAALTAKAQLENAQALVVQKEADLSAARQQLGAADASIAQAKAQWSAAREQAEAARTGITSAQAQQKAAQQGVIAAVARRQQAKGQLNQALTSPKQVDVSRSAQAQAAAKIEQARAALEYAKLQLSYTRIYAPSDGRVGEKSVEVGALVQPGTPMMAVVLQHGVWVVANFKETQLAHMRPGESCEIEVDALPGRNFHGQVDSIAAATGSTFALLPADNATGNFVKVVQRIPVKILLDEGQPDLDRLRAGMSVAAVVKTK